MRHEVITLKDAHIIGFSRGIPFNHTEACATFWNEYIERMVKPVYMEGMNLYPIHSGQWLKVYFEGGLRAFQEEFARFIRHINGPTMPHAWNGIKERTSTLQTIHVES